MTNPDKRNNSGSAPLGGKAASQDSDRFNEADQAGTGSIRSVYAVYASPASGFADDHGPTPRALTGAVAKLPRRG